MRSPPRGARLSLLVVVAARFARRRRRAADTAAAALLRPPDDVAQAVALDLDVLELLQPFLHLGVVLLQLLQVHHLLLLALLLAKAEPCRCACVALPFLVRGPRGLVCVDGDCKDLAVHRSDPERELALGHRDCSWGRAAAVPSMAAAVPVLSM